jgi:hypothetical protein
VFGSNLPVSARAAPLDAGIEIVRDCVTAKGDKAVAKVFAGDSEVAYRWVRR